MGHQFPSEFYTKTNWKNEPDTSTPLGQANLNHIEQGIKTADERIYNLDGRIGVYEDYETEISTQVQQAKDYSENAEDSATDSANSATESSGYATNSSASATQSQNYSRDSEAWAKGTRNGTAVPSTDETYHNNSKYYSEVAQQIVDDFTINNETPTFTQASTRANINSGETISTILGKIKKFFADLKTVAFTGNASDVSFDSTGTTSSAATVQAGLKEALTNSAPTASSVPYTNTTSGLSASNVQGAIDEVDGKIDTTKQIANGVIASWSSAQSLSTGYVRYNYGTSTNYSGGVSVSSLHKGILYKVTITGTCSNVVNDIEAALVLKTSNTTAVDTDSVAWAFGKTQISGTSFTIETYISIPKNVSPTYCQYWFRKSSSSTSPTVNSIYAKWEEICVNEAIDIGDYDIQSRISNIEPKSTSSQAYSTGQYFTHGDKLKKVTSAIASGDTISSSNAEDTTVGAELTQINSNLSGLKLHVFPNVTINPNADGTFQYNYGITLSNFTKGVALMSVGTNASEQCNVVGASSLIGRGSYTTSFTATIFVLYV